MIETITQKNGTNPKPQPPFLVRHQTRGTIRLINKYGKIVLLEKENSLDVGHVFGDVWEDSYWSSNELVEVDVILRNKKD
jgi:hypothetical protein